MTMSAFLTIQAAMTKLRTSTGINYAAAVDAGRFQLQIVTYGPRNHATITPCTDWVSLDDLLAAINAA
jgi:hypothetical protein